jgi:hypothetical protein
MKGGVIKNNGKSFITNTSNNQIVYPLGAGVFASNQYTVFRMEGGEISDNGIADIPGSGILIVGSKNSGRDMFILNGKVTIRDNPIGFRANTSDYFFSYPAIGSAFSSTTPTIAVDLYGVTNATEDNFADHWKGRQFLNALDEGDNTITIDDALAGIFTPVKCGIAPTNPVGAYFPNLSYKINGAGVVVDTSSGN